ncbi:MAG: NAD(P)/FAD-dependent oxidoreductase [Bacteroidales bacterium]|nr:NAD(P)/FAD-dependent oxidoreductase [Bacteroidales bacterium]
MSDKINDNSIIIIGAGFSGLAAGIYARMNGYDVTIFEMHNLPGGLCTSWERKGYTFDCCIHWLVGSSPLNGMHDIWEETGIAENRKFLDMDQYLRLEDTTGRTLVMYTDIYKLEKHLLEFSPQDEIPIKKFIEGVKMCLPFDLPSKHEPALKRLGKQAKTVFSFIADGKKMKEWMNITCESFSHEFKDPVLREVFREMWVPEFSMLFMLFTFSYLHNKNAGYPIGGSMPMSRALEERYKKLGGILKYRSRVTEIITMNDSATGVRLEDGTEHRAARIVSAADGYTTLFSMLGGKYGDTKTLEPYEKWQMFPSLIFVSLGVKRIFGEIPISVSGLTFHLKQEILIGDKVRDKLSLHLYNHDPSMAPEGCTAITIMLETDHAYWKDLSRDRKAYLQKKEEIGNTIIGLIEERFPGISGQVEAIDVATPLTFERYTGNRKGSFEGWLITPENSGVIMKPMDQSVPGLKHFYMCGQWVEPGGGLPPAIMSGRRLVKRLCKEDKKNFKTE